MATLAQGDIDILTAVERSAFYRQLYADQFARMGELKAACRWLVTPYQPGHPNLNQVLERIRTLIEADDGQPPAEDAGPQPDEMVRLQMALDAAEHEVGRLEGLLRRIHDAARDGIEGKDDYEVMREIEMLSGED